MDCLLYISFGGIGRIPGKHHSRMRSVSQGQRGPQMLDFARSSPLLKSSGLIFNSFISNRIFFPLGSYNPFSQAQITGLLTPTIFYNFSWVISFSLRRFLIRFPNLFIILSVILLILINLLLTMLSIILIIISQSRKKKIFFGVVV